MAGLFGIFFICVVAARLLVADEQEDPAALARVEERIKPVATVITDPAALVKVAAAAPAREPMTGEQVYTKLCAGCHMAGVLAAPKTDDAAAWSARKTAAGGVDGLVNSALHGKNAMPPKGGDPSLSDDEVKAAVEYMLKQSGL
ncbi:cytochrome c5 family protein [Sinimarinibacterium sp. CAU 1509]|nr:cytochrome c5 family protein [Sinimarinibacterium sp. CAU 1509]